MSLTSYKHEWHSKQTACSYITQPASETHKRCKTREKPHRAWSPWKAADQHWLESPKFHLAMLNSVAIYIKAGFEACYEIIK